MRKKYIFIVLTLFFSALVMAQKAYDTENYFAEFQGVKIIFSYANGYPEASTIIMNNNQIHQDREFNSNTNNGKITQKYNVKDGYILIYLNQFDVNNGEEFEEIKGDYFYNGNKYSLVFSKYVPSISYEEADKELNKIYSEILQKYRKAPKFLSKLIKAQNLWIKFRDAELEMRFPLNDKKNTYGSNYFACADIFLAELTKKRTNTLKQWLDNIDEYDVCKGSKGYYSEKKVTTFDTLLITNEDALEKIQNDDLNRLKYFYIEINDFIDNTVQSPLKLKLKKDLSEGFQKIKYSKLRKIRKCRKIIHLGEELYAYPFFKCKIKQNKKSFYFDKYTGSQKTRGDIYINSNDLTGVYLGAWSNTDSKSFNYGSENSEVGILFKGKSRYYLFIITPDAERYELLELK